MSRRIEITVPKEYTKHVRNILRKKEFLNYNDKSEKPGMVCEVKAVDKAIFILTVPGPAVSNILEVCRKNGIGEYVGRITLTSLEYLKPDLSEPLHRTHKQIKSKKKLNGYQHFKLARKTTEELYNEIANNTSMRINTWLNLIGASIMAAGGLATNMSVFIVASMLVSPIMGPIIGMTFGYRINNYRLFRKGFINEVKMAGGAWILGAFYALILGDLKSNSNQWPNDSMMPEKNQGFNMAISCLVSVAAGIVLGISLTSVSPNALVGTAISAGLLPPLVNSGMLTMYSWVYAPADIKNLLAEIGRYQFFFYLAHVIVIITVANIVFWLKDVNPNFKEKDDGSFNDIPTLAKFKKNLDEKSLKGSLNTEKDKALGFAKAAVSDLGETAKDVASMVTFGIFNKKGNTTSSGSVSEKSGTGKHTKKGSRIKNMFKLLDDDEDDGIVFGNEDNDDIGEDQFNPLHDDDNLEAGETVVSNEIEEVEDEIVDDEIEVPIKPNKKLYNKKLKKQSQQQVIYTVEDEHDMV